MTINMVIGIPITIIIFTIDILSVITISLTFHTGDGHILPYIWKHTHTHTYIYMCVACGDIDRIMSLAAIWTA